MPEQKIKVFHLIPRPGLQRTRQFTDQINALLKELNPKNPDLSRERLDHLLSQQLFSLFIARSGETVVGMASLFILCTLSKTQGIVHDVVVSNTCRGQGLGEQLMQAIIKYAHLANLDYIDLTSRPERLAAHKLYEKLGFKKRDTAVYRLTLNQNLV